MINPTVMHKTQASDQIPHLIIIPIISNILHHIKPPPTAKLRTALAPILKPKPFIIRNHLLMRNQRRLVSNILLRKPVDVRLHQRRAEALVLEIGQDGERVDGDGAAVGLVAEGFVVGVVRGDAHVFVGDGQACGHCRDDVAEEDEFALRGAGVDWGGGGGGRDVIAFVGGEDAEGEFGAF